MLSRHVRISFVALVTLLSLQILSASAQAGQEGEPKPAKGVLTGQFMKKDGIPLANGRVYVFGDLKGFYPTMENYWRVPDVLEILDVNGKFSIEIPAGKYYLTATERLPDVMIGPPLEGELFYFEPDAKGNPKIITVVAGNKKDVGIISTAIPFKKSVVNYTKGITAVEGVVLDAAGAPVEGVCVLAFAIPETQEKPLYISERTGKDGKFLLRTAEGGNYNLRVRSFYGGGVPNEGEIVNRQGVNELVPVTLENSKILTGVTLKAKKFSKRRAK